MVAAYFLYPFPARVSARAIAQLVAGARPAERAAPVLLSASAARPSTADAAPPLATTARRRRRAAARVKPYSISKRDNTCQVCHEGAIQVVYPACGHACACWPCAQRWRDEGHTTCTLCRTENASGFVRLYFGDSSHNSSSDKPSA